MVSAMVSIPVGQAVLQKVVTKLGGLEVAAARLGLTVSVMDAYLHGTAPVPSAVLLRAVDLVLDEFPQIHSKGPQPFNRTPA